MSSETSRVTALTGAEAAVPPPPHPRPAHRGGRTFRDRARLALGNPHVQETTDRATAGLFNRRLQAWSDAPDVEGLRDRAHEIRMRTIADLDAHMAQFVSALEAQGGRAHFCRDAAEARETVVALAQGAGAKLVAKGKSMLSEEIELNASLEAAGIQTVETDLGEYILQLAGEHPVHIVVPAIEKTVEEVARLFSGNGRAVAADSADLAATARERLRDVFLRADVGITGANFAVCDTGSICLVTNEGNGGLVSSLPRMHIALLGIERLVPKLDDLAVLLQLLARSATGQPLTTYTRLLTGPRRAGEADGPDELHVVIVDNGRSKLLGTRYEEMLACIRCGACLNVCPVYRMATGNAYGPVYSGPMGAVLAPLLQGLERAPDLPHASSLCGACTAACPVKIPLHELLLDLRRDLVGRGLVTRRERMGFALWSFAWSSPLLYRLSTAFARRLPVSLVGCAGPGRVWSTGRTVPRLGVRFRDRRRG